MAKFTLKPIAELIWLSLLIVAAILFTYFTQYKFSSIPHWLLFALILSFFSFIFFLVRAKIKLFRVNFQNWAIVISGILLIVSITLLLIAFSISEKQITGNWTSYPPLSAIKETESDEKSILNPLSVLLIFIQVAVMIILLKVILKSVKQSHN
jgi:heme/copper-type cytochrome/quinol oxidase subunit 1